ncbi:zf-C2H2_jaz domain-containing protein [Cephalotus follicularis]|uniref:Zf-C2H2_jaz domain-containing protein n=1 Tax=Cephalotus follicularis TaxID=3775 RepID=A0A1Q3D3I6_CEPFO|nr:zf-C2H2_jaz domain-containing protein [Cephalotus follicularis]
MSNMTGDGGSSFSSGNYTGGEEVLQQGQLVNDNIHLHASPNSLAFTTTTISRNGSSTQHQEHPPAKKKRNLPGNPDPSAEVIALSPQTLLATNRFVCEICNKGFQRDQNLQLHRRGHNLPWKLKQRTSTEIRKRVYVCPEPSCVHHNPIRALGDLTGIKKHFSRKHGEKKWKCDKCCKKYAVKSDWKAHSKTCGTKEYKCDCGTIFSRRDSLITHRAFCDALTEENKANQGVLMANLVPNIHDQAPRVISSMPIIGNNNPNSSILTSEFTISDSKVPLSSLQRELMPMPPAKPLHMAGSTFSNSTGSLFGGARIMSSNPSNSCLQLSASSSSMFEGNGHPLSGTTASMSATALLQKAAQMGATASSSINSPMIMQKRFNHVTSMAPPSYGAMQPQNEQSQIMEQFFNADGGLESSVMDNMGMLSGVFDHQDNIALMKHMKQESSNNNNTTVLHGTSSYNSGLSSLTSGANPSGLSKFNGDMMTVDFLGIGGSRSRSRNLHEQQQHQEMAFGGIGQPGMQGLSHFHQQHAPLEKPMWEV